MSEIIIYGSVSKKINNVLYVSEKDFIIPYGENYDIAISVLKKIEKSFFDKKSFLLAFMYDDISIWWMIYQNLMPQINKILNFIHKFQILLLNENPKKIVVRDFTYFGIIEQICKLKGIELVHSSLSLNLFLRKRYLKNFLQKYRYEKITKSKINKRLDFFKQKNFKDSLDGKILFITHSSSWKNTIHSKSSERTESWQNLINMIKNESNVVCVDIDYTLKGDGNVFLEKMNDQNNWIPMEYFLNSNYFLTNQHKIFLKNYTKIINSIEFQKLFHYDGLFFWDEIKYFFQTMTYAPYIPLYLQLMDSTKELFLKHKPKSVFLSYENGSLAQCFISSLVKSNIKTIGVQHAIIYKNSSNYVFDNFYSNSNKEGFLLPDHLLLFGTYAKNVLIENHYPIERLITFGNSFLFNLEYFKKKLDLESFILKYNIPKKQKIILFTTGRMQRGYHSIQGDYDYDERIWKYLLKKFGNDENYFLILKPHPTEYDIKIYEKILKESPCVNAKIIQDDFFKLISISNILVSVFSTTMIDALCFDKISIQVVFNNVKSPLFLEHDVILQSELSQLFTIIKNLHQDNNLTTNLSKNREIFIKNQFNIPEENPQEILSYLLNK